MSNEPLAGYFRAQADWRDSKATEYPEDERNAQSANALRSLAEFVESDENGELAYVEALGAHLFDGFIFGGEEASRAVSRYGYGYPATKGTHEEFLQELLALCLGDAYEFAGDAGEGMDDPTGALFDFEVEAAGDGVLLGRGYWTRRAKSDTLKREFEEWVEEARTVGAV